MEDLALILVKLSQKILNTGESRKLKIAKLMLNSLDPDFFTDSLILEISTFSQLNFHITTFYKQKFNEKIREAFFYEIQLDDKFFAVYKLIFDIALNGQRKQQFLNAILDMTQNQKNLLMEFVGQVVKRQEFIDFAEEEQSSKTLADNIIMQEKFIELKDEYFELQKIYLELLNSHSLLKKDHQKTMSELTHLKQEKFQLLDDLGIRHNAGYVDIIEKYRKDVEDFALQAARLHRDLDEKTAIIAKKQKQHQELILSFSTKQQHLTQTYEQKASELLRKQNLVQKKLQQAIEKEQNFRFQIVRLKDIIIDLRKQLEQKNTKLFEQEGIIDKFNQMKKIHLNFRKTMVESYRNGSTPMTSTSSGIGF